MKEQLYKVFCYGTETEGTLKYMTLNKLIETIKAGTKLGLVEPAKPKFNDTQG